jgi:hypothetical protein
MKACSERVLTRPEAKILSAVRKARLPAISSIEVPMGDAGNKAFRHVRFVKTLRGI